MYSVDSLSPPYYYAATMMCRLFGNDNSARFSIQMVPLIHSDVSSEIMDWAIILFDKIANKILEYKKDKNSGNSTPFYFCAYILDALCFNSEFPLLGWKWTLNNRFKFIYIISSYGRGISKVMFTESIMVFLFRFTK